MVKDNNVRIFITISKSDNEFLNDICKYTGFTKSELIKFSIFDYYKKNENYKKIVDIVRQV